MRLGGDDHKDAIEVVLLLGLATYKIAGSEISALARLGGVYAVFAVSKTTGRAD